MTTNKMYACMYVPCTLGLCISYVNNWLLLRAINNSVEQPITWLDHMTTKLPKVVDIKGALKYNKPIK